MLSYTQSFGAGAYASQPLGTNNPTLSNPALNNIAAANYGSVNATAANWASSLVDQVSRRPSFLPAQVIAKVDTTATPTRLIAIDKIAVPTSNINTATGAISVPTGTAVSGIASVTKNAAAFTNAGQFALFGTVVLVINPGLITPTLTGLGLSAYSVAFGTTAPTITAPTSASSGAITYSRGTTATATITGSTITLVGVGTTVITATQAANGNYASSSTSTISLTVTVPAGYITSGGLIWTRNKHDCLTGLW